MSKRRSNRKRLLPNESLRPEGEPDLFFCLSDFGECYIHKHERKTRQLCEQVAEVLGFALAECRNPYLSDLYVEAVVPAPSASRLRVVVSAESGADAVAILDALCQAKGFLRRQVAEEINRKRTPELVFGLAPQEGES